MSKLKALLVNLLFVLLALPVTAWAGTTLEVLTGTALYPTGSGNYDSDDLPGNDSTGANLVVRSQDSITYNLNLLWSGGAQTGTTIVLTLPNCDDPANAGKMGCSAGKTLAVWEYYPACGTGTTLSADGRTLTCKLADSNFSAFSGQYGFNVIARVSGQAPNASLIPTPVGTISTSESGSANRTDLVSGPVQVSARPMLDLSMSGTAAAGTGGGRSTWMYAADGMTQGVVLSFPVAVLSTKGIGNEPIVGSITVVNDLSNIVVSGGTAAQNAAVKALITSKAVPLTWGGNYSDGCHTSAVGTGGVSVAIGSDTDSRANMSSYAPSVIAGAPGDRQGVGGASPLR